MKLEFHNSNCFMHNVIVAPSNLNIILFVGMNVYSNSSKIAFISHETFLKIMIFLCEGQVVSPHIENVWEIKMSNYKCYLMETWKSYCRHSYLQII